MIARTRSPIPAPSKEDSVRTTRLRIGLTAALAALALVACGGSPTATNGVPAAGGGAAAGQAEAVFAELSALKGQQRRDELVKRAKEEGQLALYTSMTSDVADAVTKAFTDQFGIPISVYRAGSETVLQRVLQEQSAHFAGNDVVETNATELAALEREGYLAEYKGERRDLVPAAGRFPRWTATRFNLFSPGWNTGVIDSVGGPPKTWEDLADPRFDGKLSMELSDTDWYLTLYEYWKQQGKADAEIDKLFADMANGAQITKGHTVQVELMSAGQFAVAASAYTYIVERGKQDGAPIEYAPPVQPVIARPNGVALMKSATHPAAAMLFNDWILDEGQKVIADLHLTPSIIQGNDPLAGVQIIPVDVNKVLDENAEWSKKYEAVVSGGSPASN
jgi:iron(III) transport system substrate-binding protein